MAPLIRYWLFPGRLRRLPLAGAIALVLAIVLVTSGLTVAIVRQRQYAVTTGPLMIPGIVLLIGLPSILCIFGTFAGATLIAGERQKQTWETLLLSTLSVPKVVLLKLATRLVFCLLAAVPVTTWLTALMYKVVQDNGFFSVTVAPPPAIRATRIAIFLSWTFLHVIAHLVPFVALGMAVSARSKRVNEALLASSVILIVYVVLFWQMFTTLHVKDLLESSHPALTLEIFRWPVLPYLSGEYPTARNILPEGWRNTLAADLIWTLAVPALLLVPAIAWSRLDRRQTAASK